MTIALRCKLAIALPWKWKWGRRRRGQGSTAPDGQPAGEGSLARPEALTQARFGGGGDQPGGWVTVYVASGLEQAHVVKGALEAEGIPVLVVNQALSHIFGGASAWGVEIQVPRALVDRATELLQ